MLSVIRNLWRRLASAGANADAAKHYRQGLAHRKQHRLDDAAASYHRALALKPDYAEAHNNLGAILQLQGNSNAALASYERAVALDPGFSQPYLNLGRLLESLGNPAAAAACYHRALEHGIEPDTFRHLLNALEGITTERAPAAYARTVFDEFAERFDQRLVGELDYRIPQTLCERLQAFYGGSVTRLAILDLGCGTGLCGRHAAGFASRLVGVDLSPNMLVKARAHGVYHELVESDIVDYLRATPVAEFDAVLAADVFIYVGELGGVLQEVARVLRSGGVFAFSIELAPETVQDYGLLPSGRYAQSTAYISRLAMQSGLIQVETFPQVIRGKPGNGVNGQVFVLTKP